MISGQLLLGYYRVAHNEFLTGILATKANETSNENPISPFLFQDRPKAEVIHQYFYLDVFVELGIPTLLLLTGWRIWAIGSIIHLSKQ